MSEYDMNEANGMQHTLISIIIPIYNVEDYLRQCLDSVKKQSYKAIEVILVNDGSTDGSGLIAEEYAARHSWLLINQENRGLSEARHSGLEKATGEFVMFLDSDDLLAHDAVEVAYRELQKHNVDISVFRFIEFENIEEIDEATQKQHTSDEVLIVEDPLKLHLAPDERPFHFLTMTAWGKLFKKELLEHIDWDLINFRTNEDESFICYPYSKAQHGMVVLNKALYYYRNNIKSITRSKPKNIYRGTALTRMQFLEKLFEVQNEIVGPEYYAYVVNYCVCLNVSLLSRDFIGSDPTSHLVEEADITQFCRNIDEIIDTYLTLPDTLVQKDIFTVVESYKKGGFTAFLHAVLQYETRIRDEKISFYERMLEYQEREITRLHEEIRSIKSSRSWKITYPLRRISAATGGTNDSL